MKILEVTELEFPDVKVVKFARFRDHRGFFTESYRITDFENITGKPIAQINESFSESGVVRGLHFQWNPHMGKLVKAVQGSFIDMFLDIRKDSPTFGKISAHALDGTDSLDYDKWIWIPPGFAHGIVAPRNVKIMYACTGIYSQGCEAGISPLCKDIDWSPCPVNEREAIFNIFSRESLKITDKDKNGLTLQQWTDDVRSTVFNETLS